MYGNDARGYSFYFGQLGLILVLVIGFGFVKWTCRLSLEELKILNLTWTKWVSSDIKRNILLDWTIKIIKRLKIKLVINT